MDISDSKIIAGRYAVIETIGRGGMGSVYKARDLNTKKIVAVKKLRSKLLEDKRIVDRFAQESKIAGTIENENICGVLDIGKDKDGAPFFVMPLLSGITLAELLKKQEGPLPTGKAAIICCKALAGLAAAHASQIIHRDLTPKNIIVDEKGDDIDVKIVDFGISKIMNLESTATSVTGISIGTAFYMAPEQAVGQPIDRRADLYSVGVILYEALTGQRPFQLTSKAETMHKVSSKPPKTPRQLNKNIPKAMERVIIKAMSHDPSKRYSNAADMAMALLLAVGPDLVNKRTFERLTDTIENTVKDIPAFREASNIAAKNLDRRLFVAYVVIAILAIAIVILGAALIIQGKGP